MRKKLIVVVFFLLFAAGNAAVEAVDFPKPVGFVNDFAGVMDADAKQKLDGVLSSLKEKTDTEIAVVTVKDMGGLDVDTYAVELMKAWGIGSKERNDGVLVLLAIQEREWRIEVGYGLESIITDAESGMIGSNLMVPLFKNGDYSNGLSQGALAVAAIIARDKGVSLGDASLPQAPVSRRRSSGVAPFVNLIVFFIIIMLVLRSRRGRGGFLAGMLLGNMLGGGRHHHGGFGGGGFGGGFGGSGGGFGGFGGGFSGGGGASGRF